MITINNKQLVSRYRGTSKIGRVYEGSKLVWQKQQIVKVTPSDLGAIHWLPFTDSLTEDIGTSKASWQTSNSPALEAGYLKNGIVHTPSKLDYNPLNGCSFSMWINPLDTSSSLTSPIQVQATNSDIGFSYYGDSRIARWRFKRGSATLFQVNAGTVPNQWTHVAATMEPVSGTTWRNRAYINGVEVYNDTFNAGTQGRITAVTLSCNALKDNLDDYAVYNRALAAAEIKSLYDTGRK